MLQQSQADYLRILENALQYGLPVLMENVGLELDPIMESIFLKEMFRQSGSRHIKLGEKIIEYNDSFRWSMFEWYSIWIEFIFSQIVLLLLLCRIYLTTKLRKPCYPAEISAKVTIVNFEATNSILETYLLAVIVSRERPDLEAEKMQLTTHRTETSRLERLKLEVVQLEKISSFCYSTCIDPCQWWRKKFS